MLPDRVSNPGPLTYESGALPIALRGPAAFTVVCPLTMLCGLTLVLYGLRAYLTKWICPKL